MPRIPESQFNTAASTRVGEANIQQDTGGGLSNLTKAVSGLTGVFAQLQDQSERTEAYNKANNVKQEYQKQKALYENALQNVDPDGNFSAVDPFDNNPDPTKRKTYSGHISEEFGKLKEIYDRGKNESSGITRSDIAGELLDQYVGEDLMNVNLKTNRHINKVREGAVKQKTVDNINLEMGKIFDALSVGNYSPDTVRAMVAKADSNITKNIALMSPVLGYEGVTNTTKLKDQSYANSANQIIQMNMNNSTVAAAEMMINKISDPSRKNLAKMQLERTKKTTATVKAMTALNNSKSVEQNLADTPVVSPDEAIKVGNTLQSLNNVYIDPKYSSITREQVDTRVDSLATSFLTKTMFQVYSEESLDFLSFSDRVPAATGEPMEESAQIAKAQMDRLRETVSQKLDDTGFGTKLTPERKTALIDMTVEKMKLGMADFGRKLPDIIRNNNPNIQGRELFEKIALAGYEHSVRVPFVSEKQAAGFKKGFQTAMAKDSTEALMMFESTMAQAGDLASGEDSYRRALAIDLAGKDPKMSFIIPMAEATPLMKERMIETARNYSNILKENKELSETKLQQAFGNVAGDNFLSGLRAAQDTSLYQGIKQTALHLAADIAFRENTTPDNAMKKALDELKTQYASAQTTDGRASIVAVNTPVFNFSDKQKELQRGLNKAITMPMLSREEKLDLLRRNPTTASALSDKISDDNLNFLLKATIKIKPDPRFPNMHTFHFGDTALPITRKNREVIKLSAEDVVSYGTISKETKKIETGSIGVTGKL
jgi:hypothetical protein